MINIYDKPSDEFQWLNSRSPKSRELRKPSISIVLATFNGEKFLGDLLDSLNGQTCAPIEVIFGDDGSSDRTLQLINQFANQSEFLVGLKRGKNQGSSNNFLSTAKYTCGDWVIFCDQDDVWNEDRISWTIREINKDPEICAIFQSCTISAEDLTPRTHALFPGTHSPGVYAPNSLELPHVWPGFLQVLRRDLVNLATSSSRPKQQHCSQSANLIAHDRWTFILASMLGKVLVQDVSVAQFRRHAEAQTGYYDGKRNKLSKIRAVSRIRYDRCVRSYSHYFAVQSFLKRTMSQNLSVPPRLIRASSHRYLRWALESKIQSMILGATNINSFGYWIFVGLSYSRKYKNLKYMNEVIINGLLRLLRK